MKSPNLTLWIGCITLSMFLNVFILSFDAVNLNGRQTQEEPCAMEMHLDHFLGGNIKKSNDDVGRKHHPFPIRASVSDGFDGSSIGRRRRPSVTACLLLKDDNEILNEWIAYHYHALDMRYLVVAVDPTSKQSPQAILERWRKHANLESSVWTDVDFMPRRYLEKDYHIDGNASSSEFHGDDEDAEQIRSEKMQVKNHRYRQLTFLSACLRHSRALNRTWTVHIDTDEYIVVNPFLRQRKNLSKSMSSLGEASAVARVLQRVYDIPEIRDRMNHPCVSMPRVLYGAKPSLENTSLAPHGFVADKFETLRWKFHAEYDDRDRNAQPKVIVDVSHVPHDDEMFKEKPFSIHRPSKLLCRRIDQMSFRAAERYPLTVNHYVGSYERYSSRNDVRRRSMDTYYFKANATAGGLDGSISTWLNSFVRTHGRTKASILLQEYTTTYVGNGTTTTEDNIIA